MKEFLVGGETWFLWWIWQDGQDLAMAGTIAPMVLEWCLNGTRMVRQIV